MTHTSPSTYAVWSVLSTALNAFLLGHLWRFDRFKCLRWTNSPYNGAFKRIMTYTYLITLPLLMVFSYGFTYIKYKEGYLDLGGTILPKPYQFWSEDLRDAIFPLMMFFSFAWSFEMITHLEELCFWYFLITAGPSQPDWFHSPFFRLWVIGSVGALILVPTVTIVNRDEPLVCEARMFTTGSVGDLVLTLAFIPILWRFPGFIRKVKSEGVDSSIIIRLRKFFELNVIRIIFRFLMQIPLLTLGLDGLRKHHHVNESLFWTDMLSIIAALGCFVSSMCTLLIFFPRSYEAEYQAKEASLQHSTNAFSSREMHEANLTYSQNEHESGESRYGTGSPYGFRKSQDSDADLYDVDAKDFERPEPRMGTGLVRERLSSKIRERERRLKKSTKKMGAELHDALSRRLRLPLPKRRHTDPMENGSIALSFGVPSLSHSQHDKVRDATKRTEPSSRSARKGSDDGTPTAKEGGAGLERKGTYLLTDSPVLRATRLKHEQDAMRNPAASVSVETLQAAAAYGAGAAAGNPTTPAETEHAIGPGYGYGLGTKDALGYDADRKVSPLEDDDNRDVDAFALNSPSSTSAPFDSNAAVTSSPPYISSLLDSSSPTRTTQIHGPRPITKSSSLSTNATCRRALPTPPQATPIMDDPLGAAPAYSPPEGPVAPPSDQKRTRGERRRKREVDAEPRHPYADPTVAAYSSTPPPPPIEVTSQEAAQRPAYTREASDMPVSTPGVTIEPVVTGTERSRTTRFVTARPNDARGTSQGLTAANVSRHNTATRASQVNPLVHTFTSPIDFLDRIHETGNDDNGNGTQTQIGWAV